MAWQANDFAIVANGRIPTLDTIGALPIGPVIRRDVPTTNNACERALRPSVIFRKVTGGFRAEWGA